MANLSFQVTIRGTLIGDIWMPHTRCTKPLSYDLTREDRRFSEPGTLRDHVLSATNDGDFRSCEIMDGTLEVTAFVTKGARTYRRTRYFDLSLFKSIDDMVTTAEDAEYFGEDMDEEEFA